MSHSLPEPARLRLEASVSAVEEILQAEAHTVGLAMSENLAAFDYRWVESPLTRAVIIHAWTWVGIDAETKLVPSYYVGDHTSRDAYAFISDLAGRMANRIQLSTDGNRMYMTAVERAFGSEIDYGMVVKIYETDRSRGRYSPAECIGAQKAPVMGEPDEAHISTSYVERQNLTMRMGMRRFTRLTNAFSKKVENLAAAVSLHFMHYNFARTHKTLSKPYPTTPAMAAGVSDHVWTLEEIAALLD